MAKIPTNVITEKINGLNIISRGKVRDTYELPGCINYLHPYLMPYATDRISIFDFVLNANVPQKGEILNAMNIFWFIDFLSEWENDILAFGACINTYLPENLRDNIELHKRATIIKKLEMLEFEAIVRLHLTGSGYQAYKKDRVVCGHTLPSNLIDGEKLPFPIFTPTTKAKEAHDEHITADSVAEKYGVKPERLSMQIAQKAYEYALSRGIILADTKFEIGHDSSNILTFGDEKLTPDSSRFWDFEEWKKAQAEGKLPKAFDKQFVRDWGKSMGIDKLDPANEEDVVKVHSMRVPEEIIKYTTKLYRYIFWKLTGQKLEKFQINSMGIKTELQPVHIEVIIGSETDKGQIMEGLQFLDMQSNVTYNAHVLSCHRNPGELWGYAHNFAKQIKNNNTLVIAGAGAAAHLPGVIKSQLEIARHSNISVIGLAFKNDNFDHALAARLSTECLPGQPVELDENGKAFFGPEGALKACKAAVFNEFLPKRFSKKPPQYFWRSKNN